MSAALNGCARDPIKDADAALEALIDAAYSRMTNAHGDEESREHFSEMSRLIMRRSQSQQLKLELERRMRSR